MRKKRLHANVRRKSGIFIQKCFMSKYINLLMFYRNINKNRCQQLI